MNTLTFIYDVNQASRRNSKESQSSLKSKNLDLGVIKSLQSKGFIEVLDEISKHQPASIYRLALAINRDPSNVLKACRELESHGIIKLESKIVDGRAVLRPVPLYDTIRFEYRFSESNQEKRKK